MHNDPHPAYLSAAPSAEDVAAWEERQARRESAYAMQAPLIDALPPPQRRRPVRPKATHQG